MPRIRPLSNLVKEVGSQQSLIYSLKIKPSNITVFFSEEEAQNLLSVMPDIKPVKGGITNEKAKSKLIKTRLQLQSSAREAFKIALAANQIRKDQKCFAVNSTLMTESHQKEQIDEGESVLQKLRISFKKNQVLIQKLNKALNTFPLKHTVKSQDLGWILDNSSKSKQVLAQPYTLMINPTIIYGTEPSTRYQQCVSFPFIDCMIPRYNRLLVHYYNEEHRSQFIYSSGFLSRVIQHQCDHLQGRTILDWRINHGNISINPSVQQYFPKCTSVVEDYSKSLKDIFKQFPELIEPKQQYIIESKQLDKLLTIIQESLSGTQQQPKLIAKKKVGSQYDKNLNIYQNHNTNFTINKTIITDLLPFEDDFVTRIVKHFKKQFAKFDQKVQLGIIRNQHIVHQKSKQNDQLSIDLQESTYVEEIYSKQIKITYLKTEKQTVKIQQTPQQTDQQTRTEQSYDFSDEQVEKLMAKKKKGKKKK